MTYDSGEVSLEQFMFSRYPSQPVFGQKTRKRIAGRMPGLYLERQSFQRASNTHEGSFRRLEYAFRSRCRLCTTCRFRVFRVPSKHVSVCGTHVTACSQHTCVCWKHVSTHFSSMQCQFRILTAGFRCSSPVSLI